jgi:hypothetical protein
MTRRGKCVKWSVRTRHITRLPSSFTHSPASLTYHGEHARSNEHISILKLLHIRAEGAGGLIWQRKTGALQARSPVALPLTSTEMGPERPSQDRTGQDRTGRGRNLGSRSVRGARKGEVALHVSMAACGAGWLRRGDRTYSVSGWIDGGEHGSLGMQ